MAETSEYAATPEQPLPTCLDCDTPPERITETPTGETGHDGIADYRLEFQPCGHVTRTVGPSLAVYVQTAAFLDWCRS